MIIIIILLLFSLYLFWYFDQKRKLRNAARKSEKRESFIELINTLRQDDIAPETPKKEATDET